MADSESWRDQVRDKVLGVEGQWVFGRVMPGDVLDGISRYLKRATPEREKELLAQIRNRAEQLVEGDEDLAVDRPANGLLSMASVVLAAFEILQPMFDGDQHDHIPPASRRLGSATTTGSGR